MATLRLTVPPGQASVIRESLVALREVKAEALDPPYRTTGRISPERRVELAALDRLIAQLDPRPREAGADICLTGPAALIWTALWGALIDAVERLASDAGRWCGHPRAEALRAPLAGIGVLLDLLETAQRRMEAK